MKTLALLLFIVNLQLALCATIGEYININTPTTYRWELVNKYAQVTLDWNTGEFVKGDAISRDNSPECVLEQEVDCPAGKTRWHCYKCSTNRAVPLGHSCHLKFFRNLDLTDATCKLLDHYTPDNSTIIDTGLYPRTFSKARRKCTTLAQHNTPLPPHPKSGCLVHVETHRERMLTEDITILPICLDFGTCGNIQCGKVKNGGECCSKGHCIGKGCTCTSDGNGGCGC